MGKNSGGNCMKTKKRRVRRPEFYLNLKFRMTHPSQTLTQILNYLTNTIVHAADPSLPDEISTETVRVSTPLAFT